MKLEDIISSLLNYYPNTYPFLDNSSNKISLETKVMCVTKIFESFTESAAAALGLDSNKVKEGAFSQIGLVNEKVIKEQNLRYECHCQLKRDQ